MIQSTILACVVLSREALGHWGWPFELGASPSLGFKPMHHEGIAQSCDDLWETCNQWGDCGSAAVFPDCRSMGGSCTPYSFMPNMNNKDCSWMDDGYFSSYPFLQYSNEYLYQSFAAKRSDGKQFYDDVWVLHGCDGAGIQTDCQGDIFYLEHFGSRDPVAGQDCPMSDYGQTHERCPTFYHQGKGASYPDYTCGWWRGYSDAVGIERASVKDGVGAFGPAGTGGDYSHSMRNILSNCPSCAHGTALEHPYQNTNAVAYFTGALWPWICNEDAGGAPYTGQQVKCYCDNEPSNGRKPDGWPAGIPYEAMFPQDTQIVYCGLYNEKKGLVLKCDFITLNPGANMAQADFRGVEMFPTSF